MHTQATQVRHVERRSRGGSAHNLTTLNIAVLVSLALHDVDHLRQASEIDYAIPLRLFVGNASFYLPTLVALYVSWRRDRRAGSWTIASALLWMAGFFAVHIVGAGYFFGYWQTPYPRLGVDALSWVLFVVPVTVFAITAALAFRGRVDR